MWKGSLRLCQLPAGVNPIMKALGLCPNPWLVNISSIFNSDTSFFPLTLFCTCVPSGLILNDPTSIVLLGFTFLISCCSSSTSALQAAKEGKRTEYCVRIISKKRWTAVLLKGLYCSFFLFHIVRFFVRSLYWYYYALYINIEFNICYIFMQNYLKPNFI